MRQASKTVIEYLDRLVEVFRLIEAQQTGTRKEMAQKLYISPRSVTNYIQTLESLGAVVEWDRIYNTYYFVNQFNLEISVKIKTK